MRTLELELNRKHSKGVYYLSFIQLFESFSFFGMRSLLILYLIKELAYAENHAIILYTVYTALIEAGALIGGYCGDRILGFRSAITFGAIFIGMGHLALLFGGNNSFFFFGLSLIIVGSTLFRCNLKALFGSLYEKNDPRKERGFTFLYTNMNIGGFVAAIICGYVAQHYGWHYGFGIAATGMLLVIICLLHRSYFFVSIQKEAFSEPNKCCSLLPVFFIIIFLCIFLGILLSFYQVLNLILLPLTAGSFIFLVLRLCRKIPSNQRIQLIGCLGLLIIFFMVEELMGSLLMIFCDLYIDLNIFNIKIPCTALGAINPLIILLIGPLLSFLGTQYLSGLILRLAIAFLFLGIAFAILYGSLINHSSALPHVILSFSLIALGELLLVPAVFSYCSSIAPSKEGGLTMSIVAMAFALGSLCSGQISQVAYTEAAMPSCFLAVALFSCCLVISLFFYSKRSEKTI